MNLIFQCTRVKLIKRKKLWQYLETVHREGLEVRQRPTVCFFPPSYFSQCTCHKGLSGLEIQITHKLNRLRSCVHSGRRQTSWLCTSAAKDLNQVQLEKNPATSESGTSVHVKLIINMLDSSSLLRQLVLRTDVLTSIENTRPEESLRS